MKISNIFFLIVFVSCVNSFAQSLQIKGVMDLYGSVPSGDPDGLGYSGTDGKAIHLKALGDIPDLSAYSIDIISNGTGSLDPSEYILSGSVSSGDDILIYRVGSGENSASFFQDYFGDCISEFEVFINSGSPWPSGNGDDPVALFYSEEIIDSLTYGGNAIISGSFSGDPYEDSWAYRMEDGSWDFGGTDCDEDDGTYSVYTSGCPYPICSSEPIFEEYLLSFAVNSSNIEVGENGLYVGGGIFGGADALKLNDSNEDGIWTGDTLLRGSGGVRNFAFYNNPTSSNDWESQEVLIGLECSDALTGQRILPNFFSDTTLNFCFGSCETDGTCPDLPTNNITFQLDVSQVLYSGSVPYLMGSWNWDGEGDMMSDDNEDSIWDITISLVGNSFEYIFALDTNGNGTWDILENLSSAEFCTISNSLSTNRILSVSGNDSILSPVCYESCFPCNDFESNSLSLLGICHFDLPSSSGKAIHLFANEAVESLGLYSLGSANNGGGSDGEEYTFPSINLQQGDHILLCRDSLAILNYLGQDCYSLFKKVFQDNNEPSGNGNDAYELFFNGNIIEIFGNSDEDGTGMVWEYTNSWAYKDSNGQWMYGGVGCTENSESSITSDCPYPLCSYDFSSYSHEIVYKNGFMIFPNPSNANINIEHKQIIKKVNIYNLFGKIIMSKSNDTKYLKLDISHLENKFYIIEIITVDNHSIFSKILKN